jgi:hypothetical protein
MIEENIAFKKILGVFIITLLYWRYIVTFTKVLTTYRS